MSLYDWQRDNFFSRDIFMCSTERVMVVSYKRKKSRHGCVQIFCFHWAVVSQKAASKLYSHKFQIMKDWQGKKPLISVYDWQDLKIMLFSAYFQCMAGKFLMMLTPLLWQKTQKLKWNISVSIICWIFWDHFDPFHRDAIYNFNKFSAST